MHVQVLLHAWVSFRFVGHVVPVVSVTHRGTPEPCLVNREGVHEVHEVIAQLIGQGVAVAQNRL